MLEEKSRYVNKIFKGSNYLHQEDDTTFFFKKKNKVIDIYSEGKKIFFKIKYKDGYLYLCSFLALHGTWRFSEKNITYKKMTLLFKEDSRCNIVEKLYYNDKSNFGIFEVFTTDAEYKNIMKSIGPDYLSKKVDEEYFLSQIRNKRILSHEISWFLTEQKYISGIGAYINSEVLYAANINPSKKLEDITDDEAKLLFSCIMDVMNKSYEMGGYSFEDYVDPLENKGKFTTNVHNHEGELDKNGYVIIKTRTEKDGGVYWVRETQK